MDNDELTESDIEYRRELAEILDQDVWYSVAEDFYDDAKEYVESRGLPLCEYMAIESIVEFIELFK